MAVTNEFERDMNNTAFLKHPGRIDLIVFQNTADCGDGSPGLQRAFRNYLHEGGMEKDLQLLGFGIKGTSVDINNAELQQLSNIGASVITSDIWTQIANINTAVISSAEWSQIANIGSAEIDASQWGYVGTLNQELTQTSNVDFGQITMSGNIIMGSDNITFTAGGTVDGVDVSALKSDYDTHKASTGADHSYIDQSVVIAGSPTFVGLTLSADLVTTSTVDGVDVSVHAHSGAGQGGTVDHVNLNSKGSNAHSVIDTHLGSTSNPHSVGLSQAFAGDKIIAEANSEANSLQIGDGTDEIKIYTVSNNNYIHSVDGNINIQTSGTTSSNVYIKTTGTNGTVTIDSSASGTPYIYFKTANTLRWTIDTLGITPNGASAYNVGSTTQEVQYFYSCNTIQDTTCADFSHLSLDKLYNMFAQIKPMSDGGLHYEKAIDEYYAHVDFKTLPREFIHPTKEAIDHNHAVYDLNEKGEYIPRTINYDIGDCVAINTGPYMYALKDLVVKSYEKIMKLEKEIEILKNINKKVK